MPTSHSLLHTLLSLIILSPTITKTAHASPVSRCTPTNLLTNPSFEASSTDPTPWLSLATGSFSTRQLTTSDAHSGSNAYFAVSNSSTDTMSTLTLSQSYFSAPIGQTVGCYAWVKAGKRETGATRVQVFLDGASCGQPVELGGEGGKDGKDKWVRVGGEVVVRDIGGGDVGHSIAVTVQGYGEQGGREWNVTIDDVGVEVGC